MKNVIGIKYYNAHIAWAVLFRMTLHVVVPGIYGLCSTTLFCGYAETNINVPVMIEYIRKLLSRNSVRRLPGEICLYADMSVEYRISFHLNGEKMWVMWGDGQQSEPIEASTQFLHEYARPGFYLITIKGIGITALDMPGCQCVELDVSACKTLEFINCSENRLMRLDVRSCKQLYELYCINNQLTELKLSTSSKLFNVACSFNQMTDIDVSGCLNLVDLHCNGNKLCTLDVHKCRKLYTLNIEQNAFDENTLFHLASGLRYKRSESPGLLCIGHNYKYDRNKMQAYLLQKGWCEI